MSPSGKPPSLRGRAEERLRRRRKEAPQPAENDPQRLVHELQVHQIELEMQNEELVAARREIEAGLARYTEIFDFAPIGYLVLGGDGTIRELNFAGARLLGSDRQPLVGQQLSTFLAPGQQRLFHVFLGDVLAAEQGVSVSSDLTLLVPGAEPRDVHVTGALFDGELPVALCAVEDVTARRRAETALREEARNKDDFLAVLSHELRNPLAPIRNSLFVLNRADTDRDLARRAHEVIDRQVSHLTRIVDDLLEVTRIARGKIRLQRERVELGELVRHTIDDHRQIFDAGGIVLEARFGSEMFWVDADVTRIMQVLGNLLGNAVKFTGRGGRVEVFLQRDGGNVMLSVRDTGVGIAAGLRKHLFEPFSQAPQSLDRAGGGLGLGLAMVKGLVELHGGTVEAASEGPSRGSEFTIRLPLAEGPAQRAPAGPPTSRRRQRVLVIEDNLDSAESLREALESDGHTVQVAYDGPSGLTLGREFRPEIVICDIGLPGMDGYAVARALRADDVLRGAYLVALSGYALPEDVQRAVEAGFDTHVAKPPSLERLEQLFVEMPTASGRRASA